MSKETVGAFAFIRSPEDLEEVLMILRKNVPYADHWSLPGGAVKTGENKRAAVAREVNEEIGAKINIGNYIGYVKFPGDHDSSHLFTAHVFSSRYVSGDLRLQRSEIAQISWMKEDSIPYRKVAKPVVEFYKEMKKIPEGEIVKVDLVSERN